MKSKLFIACIACLIFPFSLLYSQLNVALFTPDPISMGIAGTRTATPATYNAIFDNTAALSFADHRASAGLSYRNLYKSDYFQTTLYQVSGYYKINRRLALGLGINYADAGKITLTGGAGNPVGTFHRSETEASGGLSIKLTEHLAASVDVKLLRENRGDFFSNDVHIHPANSIAGDIGLYYRNIVDTAKLQIFTAGLTISNLGPRLKFAGDPGEYLPAILKMGAGFSFVINKKNNIGIYIDLNKLLTPVYYEADTNQNYIEDVMEQNVPESIVHSFSDSPDGLEGEINEIYASLGISYTCNNALSLRAGMNLAGEDPYENNFLTLGAGYRYRFIEANISFLEYFEEDESDFFNNDHKLMLGVNVNFGQI